MPVSLNELDELENYIDNTIDEILKSIDEYDLSQDKVNQDQSVASMSATEIPIVDHNGTHLNSHCRRSINYLFKGTSYGSTSTKYLKNINSVVNHKPITDKNGNLHHSFTLGDKRAAFWRLRYLRNSDSDLDVVGSPDSSANNNGKCKKHNSNSTTLAFMNAKKFKFRGLTNGPVINGDPLPFSIISKCTLNDVYKDNTGRKWLKRHASLLSREESRLMHEKACHMLKDSLRHYYNNYGSSGHYMPHLDSSAKNTTNDRPPPKRSLSLRHPYKKNIKKRSTLNEPQKQTQIVEWLKAYRDRLEPIVNCNSNEAPPEKPISRQDTNVKTVSRINGNTQKLPNIFISKTDSHRRSSDDGYYAQSNNSNSSTSINDYPIRKSSIFNFKQFFYKASTSLIHSTGNATKDKPNTRLKLNGSCKIPTNPTSLTPEHGTDMGNITNGIPQPSYESCTLPRKWYNSNVAMQPKPGQRDHHWSKKSLMSEHKNDVSNCFSLNNNTNDAFHQCLIDSEMCVDTFSVISDGSISSDGFTTPILQISFTSNLVLDSGPQTHLPSTQSPLDGSNNISGKPRGSPIPNNLFVINRVISPASSLKSTSKIWNSFDYDSNGAKCLDLTEMPNDILVDIQNLPTQIFSCLQDHFGSKGDKRGLLHVHTIKDELPNEVTNDSEAINDQNITNAEPLGTETMNSFKSKSGSRKSISALRRKTTIFRKSYKSKAIESPSNNGNTTINQPRINSCLTELLDKTTALFLPSHPTSSLKLVHSPKLVSQLHLNNVRSIFGLDLMVHYLEFGNSLPAVISDALAYIERHSPGSNGIFRKAGSKNRVNSLRYLLDEAYRQGSGINLDDFLLFDIADVIKQFYRELRTGPIICDKLTDKLVQIYGNYSPTNQEDSSIPQLVNQIRFWTLSIPIYIREALFPLLRTCNTISINNFNRSHHETSILSSQCASVLIASNEESSTPDDLTPILPRKNVMTPNNLAICLLPTLMPQGVFDNLKFGKDKFDKGINNQTSSPYDPRTKYGQSSDSESLSRSFSSLNIQSPPPRQLDNQMIMNENKSGGISKLDCNYQAAVNVLAFIIQHCNKIDKVPCNLIHEIVVKNNLKLTYDIRANHFAYILPQINNSTDLRRAIRNHVKILMKHLSNNQAFSRISTFNSTNQFNNDHQHGIRSGSGQSFIDHIQIYCKPLITQESYISSHSKCFTLPDWENVEGQDKFNGSIQKNVPLIFMVKAIAYFRAKPSHILSIINQNNDLLDSKFSCNQNFEDCVLYLKPRIVKVRDSQQSNNASTYCAKNYQLNNRCRKWLSVCFSVQPSKSFLEVIKPLDPIDEIYPSPLNNASSNMAIYFNDFMLIPIDKNIKCCNSPKLDGDIINDNTNCQDKTVTDHGDCTNDGYVTKLIYVSALDIKGHENDYFLNIFSQRITRYLSAIRKLLTTKN